MKNLSIATNWNKMAQAYENFSASPNSYSNAIEWKAIKELLPDLKDKKILDLGCGTGRFSFLFEQFSPKEILGMDISQKMLSIAKFLSEKNSSKVKFIEYDMEDLSGIKPNSFDFIFSSTSLHYLKNLNTIMDELHRILEKQGTCILSIINPIYTATYPIMKDDFSFPEASEWEVKYLDKSVRAYVQPWIEYNDDIDDYLSFSYHHTMSDYINSIIKAGFSIEYFSEPLPPSEWKESDPSRYASYINTPVYGIFKLKKLI